jgi:hypothetical protein
MACLDEGRRGVEALIDVFARADANVVANAIQAVDALPRIDRCSDASALRARVRPPNDRAMVTRVDDVRMQIARADAARSAGRYQEALAQAKSVVALARGIEYLPTQAESLMSYGMAQTRTGDVHGAAESLYQSAWLADAAGDDRRRAWAWVMLVGVVAARQGKFELLPMLSGQATAALKRSGGDTEIEGHLSVNSAMALFFQAKFGEARTELEKGTALLSSVLGPSSREVAKCLSNSSSFLIRAAKFDEAVELQERARVMLEGKLGPDHPDVALALANIGAARAVGLVESRLDVSLRRLLGATAPE